MDIKTDTSYSAVSPNIQWKVTVDWGWWRFCPLWCLSYWLNEALNMHFVLRCSFWWSRYHQRRQQRQSKVVCFHFKVSPWINYMIHRLHLSRSMTRCRHLSLRAVWQGPSPLDYRRCCTTCQTKETFVIVDHSNVARWWIPESYSKRQPEQIWQIATNWASAVSECIGGDRFI